MLNKYTVNTFSDYLIAAPKKQKYSASSCLLPRILCKDGNGTLAKHKSGVWGEGLSTRMELPHRLIWLFLTGKAQLLGGRSNTNIGVPSVQ